MSTDSPAPTINDERDLLASELLPELEHHLAEYGDYELRNETDAHITEFEGIVRNEYTIDDYPLPTLQTTEFGTIYPEYFVVEQGSDLDEYAVAIEPHTKFIDVREEELAPLINDFAEEWKDNTLIEELDLGYADVSKVSMTTPELHDSFADRI